MLNKLALLSIISFSIFCEQTTFASTSESTDNMTRISTLKAMYSQSNGENNKNNKEIFLKYSDRNLLNAYIRQKAYNEALDNKEISGIDYSDEMYAEDSICAMSSSRRFSIYPDLTQGGIIVKPIVKDYKILSNGDVRTSIYVSDYENPNKKKWAMSIDYKMKCENGKCLIIDQKINHTGQGLHDSLLSEVKENCQIK